MIQTHLAAPLGNINFRLLHSIVGGCCSEAVWGGGGADSSQTRDWLAGEDDMSV